ncbi:hypothetical protein AAG570_000846 [Ranatra chinensis]|uniref:Major facilitator superfamily (MFS) profile domain-containing protein n=1 Tax=Ranatra chinensis TaxID=642074 RepID=A0ABD0ZJG9_9HEMI
MADGAQMFIINYLVPGIQAEMCLQESKVICISMVTLVGLMFGSLLCTLADHVGRKTLLVVALVLHLLFNISAAFTPTFGVFVTARFGSALGLGICYPVAYIYFMEFLPHAARHRCSILMLFWALGGAYALSLAYFLLPQNGEAVVKEASEEHNNSWHRVLLLSSVPGVLALASLLCTSESARYLLNAGKDVDAIMVYQQMYKWNASRSAQYQLTELELPSKPAPTLSSKHSPPKSVWGNMCANIATFFQSIRQLGQRTNLIAIVLLSMVWSSLGYSYYGMSVWVPARIQWLKDSEYKAKAELIRDTEEYGRLYTTSLVNTVYSNVTFRSCTFAHITLVHVTFQGSTFENVEFTNILSSKTYFIDSVIENSRFIDTDLTSDHFIGCEMVNNTMMSFEGECRTDLDFANQLHDIFLKENIIRVVCPFVALALNAILIHKLKKINVAVASMLFCSLTCLLILMLYTELALLAFDTYWSLIFVFAFNAVNIISTEVFPVNVRATGFGFVFYFFRVFGLNGVITFGSHVGGGVSTLLVGGIALFRMPDTSSNLM